MVSGGGNAAAVDLPGYVLKIHPSGQSGGLDRQAVPPRQQDFDAEPFVLFQQPKILDGQNETGQNYTILSDSTAATAAPGPMILAPDRVRNCYHRGVQPLDQPGEHLDVDMGT